MANNFYDKKIDRYTLLHDAYYGVGLFENGEGLRKHPREMEENFADRKALAYYLNYLNGIVNSVVDPIFKDDIKDFKNVMKELCEKGGCPIVEMIDTRANNEAMGRVDKTSSAENDEEDDEEPKEEQPSQPANNGNNKPTPTPAQGAKSTEKHDEQSTDTGIPTGKN